MYIDSHAHLNFNSFDGDWQATAERAFDADVLGIINIGSQRGVSIKAVEMAEAFENEKLSNGKLYATVGQHPIHALEELFDAEEYLQLAQKKSVVAIGETGIDMYYDPSTLDDQKKLFISHIELARATGKPLIIHNRMAGNELLNMVKEYKVRHGVVHFFSENWDMAEQFMDLGLYLSFTGAITLDTINDFTLEVIKKMPLDRMMIETDSPYVVPKAQKDDSIKRNEPAYVVEVAKKIAEIRDIDIEKVAKATTHNAIKLFDLR